MFAIQFGSSNMETIMKVKDSPDDDFKSSNRKKNERIIAKESLTLNPECEMMFNGDAQTENIANNKVEKEKLCSEVTVAPADNTHCPNNKQLSFTQFF